MFSRFNEFGHPLPAPNPHAVLRALSARFQELEAMDDRPTERGKAFNGFLAALLRADGLEAHADQRGQDGRDEIDVAFSFEQRHFILEAKWLAERVNDDAVEKLRGRLKVRLSGTIGVFVSMRGYTQPAIDKAKWFSDVILLDRSHVEALTTGLLTASELLSRIMLWVTRRGGAYAPLGELLTGLPESDGAATWIRPDAETTPQVLGQAAGISATAVLTAPAGTALTGVTANEGVLILTSNDGVMRLDPRTGKSRRLLPLPGSRDAALQDGTHTRVLCGASAVSATSGTEIQPLAGPFPHLALLLRSPEGETWVFASTGAPGYGGRHTLTRLAGGPAGQREHEIDFVGKIDRAVLLPGGRIYIVGGSRAGVLDIEERMTFPEAEWKSAPPLTECSALLPLGEHILLSAGRASGGSAVEVYRTDLRTHGHELLLTINGQRAISLVANDDGAVQLVVDAWLPRSALPRPVLYAVTLP